MCCEGADSVRTVLALLAAPLLPSLLAGYSSIQNKTYMPAPAFIASYVTILVIGIVVGIPAYIALRRLLQNHIRVYALLGPLAVGLPIFLWMLYESIDGGHQLDGMAALRAAFHGLLSALTFWLIARPNKGQAS
jgi:predicted Na+-dependent transporter